MRCLASKTKMRCLASWVAGLVSVIVGSGGVRNPRCLKKEIFGRRRSFEVQKQI